MFDLKAGGQIVQYGLRPGGGTLLGEVEVVTARGTGLAPVLCQRDEITDQGTPNGRK